MANIYYVDPVNGSNDNDGTSTDAPLASPIKDDLDYGSYDDPAVFYFKRGTTFTLPDESTDITFAIMMSWPSSDDGEYWDNRPDDGTDWDDDDSARAVIQFPDNGCFNLPDDDSNIISFRNITLNSVDDKDGNPCVVIKNSTVEFIDCEHSGRLKHYLVAVKAVDSNVELDVTLNILRSTLNSDGRNGRIYDLWEASNYKFYKNIIIQDSSFNGWERIISHDRRAGWRTYWSNIKFLNSTVDNTTYFAWFLDDASYGDPDGGIVDLLIQDSDMHTTSYSIRTGGQYDDRQTPKNITINVINSSITADSNPIFYFEEDGSDSTNNRYVYAYNSTFDGTQFIKKDDSADSGYYYIKSIKNTFKNMDNVFYFRGRPYIEQLDIINNTYTACSEIIYASSGNDYMNNLFFNESYLNVDKIINGNWNKGTIILKHSKINGQIVDYKNSILNIKLYDVECNNIVTNGPIELNNCLIHQDGKFPIQPFYGLIKNSVIDSNDYNIDSADTNKLIFDNCTINSSYSLFKDNKEIMILNCKVNDEDRPYVRLLANQVREVAAPYRINGASYSLMIDNGTRLQDIGIDELEIAYDSAHPTVKVYFASLQDVSTDNYIISAYANYQKDDTTGSVAMTLAPSDEDWDGLPDGYYLFELSADMSNEGLENGDIINVSLDFAQINYEHLKIYLDPKMDNV